jgi:GNAT superfamily N-acetyltransferase
MYSPISPYREPGFDEWKEQLEALPHSEPMVRDAEPTVQDGRWMRWVQEDCESTNIQDVEYNTSKIEQQLVLVAEIAGHPVGYCIALVGATDTDPLFIQLVAVVPLARRRGTGIALLSAAAQREPRRSIAMATLSDNVAARGLNERFAKLIGASIRRVPTRRYRRADLGFAAGELHQPWMVERPKLLG